MNSVVVDRLHGIVAEGMNGTTASRIPEGGLNPAIESEINRMTKKEGEEKYVIYEADGKTIQDYSDTPHPDWPDRHAEIKAANRILNLLQKKYPSDAKISNLQVDNWFTLKGDGGKDGGDCACCANCNEILRDARVPRVGRNTHHKNDPALSRIYDK
ncbi:hypothetical protein [Nocardiopsis synnemataformans]|uniref:hypothetical protein n=1 Tax=Nocardiopsis synnemataformans TaxID=61305 RepID=UPI003EBA16DD